MNAVLPKSIAVVWAKEVPEGLPCPLQRIGPLVSLYHLEQRSAATVTGALHLSPLTGVGGGSDAGGVPVLIGNKDFGAFGRSPDATNPRKPGPHSCVRTMLDARCIRQDAQALIYCDFTANAFLTGMVRRMVGTLLLVGQHRISLDEFAAIVQHADKTHPGSAAPPHGLCLVRVDYPEEFGVIHDDENI